MVKVKYKEISAEFHKVTAPTNAENTRGSIYSSTNVIEHYNLDTKKLIPFNKQARVSFNEDDIKALAASIKQHGIRQPLTVVQSPKEKEKYEVISGERRLRAARELGLPRVPCIIISDYEKAEEIALVENIQREDLHPIELGEALLEIISSREDISQQKLSERLGVTKQFVSEYIQFAKLPSAVKKRVVTEKMDTREFLRKLSKAQDPMKLLDLNSKRPYQKVISVSLLRVFLKDGDFAIQANGISALTVEQRAVLKKKIEETFEKF